MVKCVRNPIWEIALRIIVFILFTIIIPIILFLTGSFLVSLLVINLGGDNIELCVLVGILYGLPAGPLCFLLHEWLVEKLFIMWP